MRKTRVILPTVIILALGLIIGYLTIGAMFGQASPGQPDSSTASVADAGYTYTFTIDRSAAPQLFYNQLTYVVHLGDISDATVLVDGEQLQASYDPRGGELRFSTERAGSVVIHVTGAKPGAVSVRKAALKDDKALAWSHGMDDNVNLQAQIELITAKGWRGSLMLIGEKIDDTRDEEWIVDKPALVRLRNAGWSLGTHSWDHNCDSDSGDDTLRQTIIDGYNRLMEVVASSDDPSYQVLTLAAPCVISAYTPIFDRLVDEGSTTLRLNETQGEPLMNVDGEEFTDGEVTAAAMSGADREIGRDMSIGIDPSETIATLDWMAANAAADRHFWFNTLSHGNREDDLGLVLDHAYANYGPGGSDTLWMAPSDEIYSYLLIRDATVVTPGDLSAP